MVVVNSFISEAEVARRGSFILWPQAIDLTAYKMLLANTDIIYQAYGVTIFRTVVGSFISLLFTVTLAYGLSKKNLPGNSFISGMIFFTMLFSGGLIPSFLLIKQLGLYDSIWVLIIPNLLSAWNMFLMRNFFRSIPQSLEEAATIDGANPIQTLFKVILPLSVPAIATIGLFYAVGHWNDWFTANIYINDLKLLPVQNIMRRIILSNDIGSMGGEMVAGLVGDTPPMPKTLKAAAMVIGTVPIMIVYPCLQKYFVKGVSVGSVKG